jgi:hypothetical protein
MMEDYKFIPLTRGQYAIVDADDYDWLNQWRWNAAIADTGNYYAVRRLRTNDGTILSLRMHNLILDTPKDLVGDHWNGDTLDNRRCNLRAVTRSVNCLNIAGSIDRSGAPERITDDPPEGLKRPLSVRNTSGFEHVFSWRNQWIAMFEVNGNRYHLGLYKTAEEANQVCAEAKAKLAANPRYRPKQKLSKRNTSGVKGVSWHKAGKKWRVTTTITHADGWKEHVHIGSYSRKQDAITARNKYERERKSA